MNMNAKNLIAAVTVLAAASSAFAAGNPEFVEFTNVQSTKTRAEVRAELAQATKTPEFVEFTNVASNKTRDEVRQEALQASREQRHESTYFGG
jgi:hypothetical protein